MALCPVHGRRYRDVIPAPRDICFVMLVLGCVGGPGVKAQSPMLINHQSHLSQPSLLILPAAVTSHLASHTPGQNICSTSLLFPVPGAQYQQPQTATAIPVHAILPVSFVPVLSRCDYRVQPTGYSSTFNVQQYVIWDSHSSRAVDDKLTSEFNEPSGP